MQMYWTIISCILPLIPLLFLAKIVSTFEKTLQKKRVVRETEIKFTGVRSLFPNQLRDKLYENKKVIKRDADEVVAVYRRVIRVLIFYILFWITYIAYTIYGIFDLITQTTINGDSVILGAEIGTLLVNVLMTYWLFLTPIFELLHFSRLVDAGVVAWNIVCKFVDVVVKLFTVFSKYFVEISLCFGLLYGYILLINYVFEVLQIEKSIFVVLPWLMMYQYLLLSLISKVLWFFWKKNKNICRFDYTESIIKRSLQNCTYVCMVGIYAFAQNWGMTDNILAGALGILFLIDTFLKEEKQIKLDIGMEKR